MEKFRDNRGVYFCDLSHPRIKLKKRKEEFIVKISDKYITVKEDGRLGEISIYEEAARIELRDIEKIVKELKKKYDNIKIFSAIPQNKTFPALQFVRNVKEITIIRRCYFCGNVLSIITKQSPRVDDLEEIENMGLYIDNFGKLAKDEFISFDKRNEKDINCECRFNIKNGVRIC